jgi:hypothetical protein
MGKATFFYQFSNKQDFSHCLRVTSAVPVPNVSFSDRMMLMSVTFILGSTKFAI